MKRQPLTIIGNPIGSTTAVVSSGIGGGLGTPSRPNTAKSGTGRCTAGGEGGRGRFEVQIERTTTEEYLREDDEEDERGSETRVGSSGSSVKEKGGFDEEIEMDHLR
jgi:hypothetical protein